jgi:RimJ/RimL family protein N-acetyltransferase
VAACQDPEIPKWTLVPEPYSEDDARLWLAAQSAARRGGRRVELAIVDGDDRLLGSIAIARSIDGRAGEVGYWIARDARRRGVATRAVELLSTWAFSELGLERIELLAEPDNAASIRVAERLGARSDGARRHPDHPDGPELLAFELMPELLARSISQNARP